MWFCRLGCGVRVCEGEGGLYLFGDVADCGEYSQYIQEAIMVVLTLNWSAGVAFRQCFEDLGRDQFGAEERRCRVGNGCLKSHCNLLESSCGSQCGIRGERAFLVGN